MSDSKLVCQPRVRLPWWELQGGKARTNDAFQLGVVEVISQDFFCVLVQGLVPLRLKFRYDQVAMSMKGWGDIPIVELTLSREELMRHLIRLQVATANPFEMYDQPVVWTNDEVTFA
jgi:hypothetical protein